MGKKNQFDGVVAVALRDFDATLECPEGVHRGQLVYIVESILGEGKFKAEVLREQGGQLHVIGRGDYDSECFDFVKFDKKQKKLIKPFLKTKEKERKAQSKKNRRPTPSSGADPIASPTSHSTPSQQNQSDSKSQSKKKRFSAVVDKLKRSSSRFTKKGGDHTPSSKHRTPRSSKKSAGTASQKMLFGLPLDKVMAENAPPVFLLQAGERVLAHLAEEGIFRISGSASALVELKSLLEECERDRLRAWIRHHGRHTPIPPAPSCPVDFSQVPVHTAAGLIKLFFRDLPDSLLPTAMYHDFLDLVAIKDHAQCLTTAAKLLQALPARNLCLFHWLAQLLRQVAAVPANKMGYSNIAIVFGPTILLAHDASFAMDQIAVTTFLLQHYPQIAPAHLLSSSSTTSSSLTSSSNNPNASPALNLSEDDLPTASDLDSDASESEFSDSHQEEDDDTTLADDQSSSTSSSHQFYGPPPPRPLRRPRTASTGSLAADASEPEPHRHHSTRRSLKRLTTFGINMDELRSRLKRRGETEEEKEDRLREEEDRVRKLLEEEAQQVAAATEELEHQVAVATQAAQAGVTVASPVMRRLVLPPLPDPPVGTLIQLPGSPPTGNNPIESTPLLVSTSPRPTAPPSSQTASQSNLHTILDQTNNDLPREPEFHIQPQQDTTEGCCAKCIIL